MATYGKADHILLSLLLIMFIAGIALAATNFVAYAATSDLPKQQDANIRRLCPIEYCRLISTADCGSCFANDQPGKIRHWKCHIEDPCTGYVGAEYDTYECVLICG
ncbi:MAG: hypothetical protein PHQ40_12655 [Anaerolineaceae bacterium]|nr:hypothetical protein [Anaerolineaceae bacterium]